MKIQRFTCFHELVSRTNEVKEVELIKQREQKNPILSAPKTKFTEFILSIFSVNSEILTLKFFHRYSSIFCLCQTLCQDVVSLIQTQSQSILSITSQEDNHSDPRLPLIRKNYSASTVERYRTNPCLIYFFIEVFELI